MAMAKIRPNAHTSTAWKQEPYLEVWEMEIPISEPILGACHQLDPRAWSKEMKYSNLLVVNRIKMLSGVNFTIVSSRELRGKFYKIKGQHTSGVNQNVGKSFITWISYGFICSDSEWFFENQYKDDNHSVSIEMHIFL